MARTSTASPKTGSAIRYDGDPLDPYIKAAIGFFELGDQDSCLEELKKIPIKFLTTGTLKTLTLEFYKGLERWDLLATFALSLPETPSYRLYLAAAEKNRSGPAAAEKVLRQTLLKFPDHAIMQYYLACYVCQQGRLEEARLMVGRAMELDSELRVYLHRSPELEPIRHAFKVSKELTRTRSHGR